MNKQYPDEIDLSDGNLSLFFSSAATNIDNHILGKTNVQIDYVNILRVGKLLYGISQEKHKYFGSMPGIFEIFTETIPSYVGKELGSEGLKTTDDLRGYLEVISQEFGAFGALDRKKQEDLRDLCCNLSNSVGSFQSRYHSSKRCFAA